MEGVYLQFLATVDAWSIEDGRLLLGQPPGGVAVFDSPG
jgi:hypothetical protein